MPVGRVTVRFYSKDSGFVDRRSVRRSCDLCEFRDPDGRSNRRGRRLRRRSRGCTTQRTERTSLFDGLDGCDVVREGLLAPARDEDLPGKGNLSPPDPVLPGDVCVAAPIAVMKDRVGGHQVAVAKDDLGRVHGISQKSMMGVGGGGMTGDRGGLRGPWGT